MTDTSTKRINMILITVNKKQGACEKCEYVKKFLSERNMHYVEKVVPQGGDLADCLDKTNPDDLEIMAALTMHGGWDLRKLPVAVINGVGVVGALSIKNHITNLIKEPSDGISERDD